MQKIIVGLVIIVSVAAGVVLVNGGQKDNKAENVTPSTAPTSNTAKDSKGKSACELLPLETAKKLLGENATLVEGGGSENAATTENVKVDNCTYSSEGATLGDLKQLTIQVQSGDSNQVKQAYENYKKEYPGTPLPELGEEAYYATETKQVNVLQDGTWIFVAGGSINAGDAANKELQISATKLALEKL